MKHAAILTIFAAIVMLFPSCEKTPSVKTDENPYKALELNTRSTEYVKQGNTFAFNFLSKVSGATGEDFIVSPLSMQFLLGMILDGTAGQTAEEICSVLGFGAGETADVNEYCLSMLRQLPALDKKTRLAIANAIVVNRNYKLLDSYISTVGRYYAAEVSEMDFADKAGTVKKINRWASDHTEGLIPKIIDSVSEDMAAILMNALYFKGQWKNKFPKGSTSAGSFINDMGMVMVPMMSNTDDYYYQENDTFRAVRMLYGNGAFAMYVILPSEGKTLADVSAGLDAAAWKDFLSSMVPCYVDLMLPKFETKYSICLNDILSEMGMPSSFNPMTADFSGMSERALFLSQVKQDAVIKVDEEGSEAAAVSSAVVGETAVGPHDSVVFHADRPFLYLITESSTGAILFAGRYSGRDVQMIPE